MRDPSIAARPGPSGWPLVLLLAATQLSAFSDRFLMTLVATPLKQALALSDTQLGLLQGSAFAVLNALALPAAGSLADRGHRRSLLLASIVLWSAATLACGLAGSFAALFASRMALGLGQAGIAPAALSLMAVRLERGKLGRGVSFLTSGASLGRSLTLLAGGAALAWLTVNGGWRVPGIGHLAPWQALFVLAVVPNLALALLVGRIVEPPPARRSPRMGLALAWVVRRRAAYLPHLGAASAAVLMGQALTAWAPTFYVRAFGFTPAQTGLTLGLIVLCAAPLGHLAGGLVLDRLRRARRRAAVPLMLGLGLPLALPPAAGMALAPDLAVSLAGFFLLVAVLGFTSPPGLAGIQFLTPVALRGRVSALFLAGTTLAAFGLGPFLVGLLSDAVFGEQGLGRAMLTLFSGTVLVGVLFAHRAARPRLRTRRVDGRISPQPATRRAG